MKSPSHLTLDGRRIVQNSKPKVYRWGEIGYLAVNVAASNSIQRAFELTIGRPDHASHVIEGGYVFSFVRNPWDRMVSSYRHCRKPTDGMRARGFSKKMTFDEYVERAISLTDECADKHFVSQLYKLSQDGRLLPDFIGKVENIGADWRRLRKILLKKYDVHLPRRLPRLKVTRKYNRITEWDPELERKFRKRFAADYEAFGYR